MVAVALTDIAGSSDVFERGFVSYSNAAKVEVLGVSPETLAAHGAVSEPVAQAMAEGALAHSHADLAVSVRMAGSIPEGMGPIAGDNQLPSVGEMKLALYRANRRSDEAVEHLMSELRCAYGA